MKLVSYQYVGVRDWCRSVEARDLLKGSGNRVYIHGEIPLQPPIDVIGLRDKGKAFSDLVRAEDRISIHAKNLDPLTRTIAPLSAPFVAKLENVRIEFPGFGVFVDPNLVLAESYHNAEYTTAVIDWYGKFGLRHKVRLGVQFGSASGAKTEILDAMYFVDNGTDQYCDEPVIFFK